ncbi:MAG TPA: phage tail sheath subtilisin-like domain-containing protein [Thermopolyspora sp.]
MTVSTPYPGVYVNEISSGVRTITGVATSITAFLGTTRRGPVNQATLVNGFADYQRIFGGVWRDSTVSFAVRDFFANGGGQAVIVRLVNEATTARLAPLPVAEGDEEKAGLVLEAVEPGSWADHLSAGVTYPTSADASVLDRLGVTKDDLFHLTVTDTVTGEQETFHNVHVTTGVRRVDAVLAAESRLVRATGVPASRPLETKKPVIVATPGEDGDPLEFGDYADPGLSSTHKGIWALDLVDQFNLLCIPPPTRAGNTLNTVYQAAMKYCQDRRAMLIVDPPAAMTVATATTDLQGLGLTGEAARNAALYYPRVRQADPTAEGRLDTFVGCGVIAGVMARTDSTRGVWKAPAGLDASLAGVADLAVNLTDPENGLLNSIGVNCLRTLPVAGRVVWGARTLRGADQLGDEYKYVPVRRLALYIEESLFRGTQWVVFEPNDEPLWAQIRLNVGAFLQNLFRQGAFQGSTPRDAYFVKCDRETTTPNDVNSGRVNIHVGFAPVRPAEFVLIQIQQIAQA